jgi:hypothetical protein
MKGTHVLERAIAGGGEEGVEDRAIFVRRAVRFCRVLHVRLDVIGETNRSAPLQPLPPLEGREPVFVGDSTRQRAIGGVRALAIALPIEPIEEPEGMSAPARIRAVASLEQVHESPSARTVCVKM